MYVFSLSLIYLLDTSGCACEVGLVNASEYKWLWNKVEVEVSITRRQELGKRFTSLNKAHLLMLHDRKVLALVGV